MQTVEITAKTVQDATSQAADKLGVPAEKLKVTVLEETKGLFGKSSVRVRAEVVESAEAPAVEVEPEAEVPAPKPSRGKKAVAEPATVVEEPVVEAKPDNRRNRSKKSEPAAPEAAAVEVTEEVPDAVSEVVASEKDAETLVALVRELLDAAQLNVTAHLGSIAGRYVNIILDGKDVAFIVGKHGEVLNAMQYLVNIISSRKIERGVRATLDGNDYRRRREEALTQLAQRIAEQVMKRGEEAVLDALPAFERRIVHKALSELEGITTYSEGEEPNRRVVIAPAD